jgi:hypothetical protein
VGRLVGVALLALLLAQWTALTHAVAHAPLAADMALAAEAESPWGHGVNSPSCDLIDHLLLGHAMLGDPSPLAWVPPEATLAKVPKSRLFRSGTRQAYEARGPPRA